MEGYGRDQKNLSRAESPINTGLTADDGRDEHINKGAPRLKCPSIINNL